MRFIYQSNEGLGFHLNKPKSKQPQRDATFNLYLVPPEGVFSTRPTYSIVTSGAKLDGKPVKTPAIRKNRKSQPFSDTAVYSFSIPSDFTTDDSVDLVGQAEDGDPIVIGKILAWPNAEIVKLEKEILAAKQPEKFLKKVIFKKFLTRIDSFPTSLQNSPELMKVRLYLYAAGRFRPLFTRRIMKRLADVHSANDTRAEFTTIEKQVEAMLKPYVLMPHGYTKKVPFRDIPMQDICDRVAQISNFWETRGYTVFLNSGALLGIVRDKQFLPHDDDIDLGLILKSTKIEDIVEEWGTIFDIALENGMVDTVRQPDLKGKFAMVHKFLGPQNLQIDLFPCWFNADDKFTVYPHSYQNLDRDDILPLRKSEIGDLLLPNNAEKMLENNYGAGWVSPDSYYEFPWRTVKKKFRKFEIEARRRIREEKEKP